LDNLPLEVRIEIFLKKFLVQLASHKSESPAALQQPPNGAHLGKALAAGGNTGWVLVFVFLVFFTFYLNHRPPRIPRI
jgi:hypothetical protein